MRPKGFTLLELAVASALTVLLAGATAALLIRGLNAVGRTEASVQQLFRLERTAEKMGRELRNAVAAADGRFEGSPGEVSFLLSENPTELTFVRYHLVSSGNGKSLLREWGSFPAGDRPLRSAAVLTRVVNFSILYGMIRQEEGKRLLQWSESWSVPPTEEAVLPELVQVRLESEDSKGRPTSVTREFLIPQGVLRSASSAS